MFVNNSRKKMINAIVYFATHTDFCGKIKLSKLLYLLDFEHFRNTGESVTDLSYRAWKFGPVPIELYQEWDAPENDFSAALSIEMHKVHGDTVVTRSDFDIGDFTKREFNLMSSLAIQYADVPHNQIDVLTAVNGAWARVWNNGSGFDEQIPYEFSVADDAPNRIAVLEAAAESRAIRRSEDAAHHA